MRETGLLSVEWLVKLYPDGRYGTIYHLGSSSTRARACKLAKISNISYA